MFRKALWIDSGRGDNQLQIGPPPGQLPQIAQQKIDIQRSLVGFVDNQCVVLIQEAVALRFSQEHAVGHQFNQRVGAGSVGEADLETDALPNR